MEQVLDLLVLECVVICVRVVVLSFSMSEVLLLLLSNLSKVGLGWWAERGGAIVDEEPEAAREGDRPPEAEAPLPGCSELDEMSRFPGDSPSAPPRIWEFFIPLLSTILKIPSAPRLATEWALPDEGCLCRRTLPAGEL